MNRDTLFGTPACCTDTGECGVELAIGCIVPALDADCPNGAGVGCCQANGFCGEIDAVTGECRDGSAAAESERVRQMASGTLSAFAVQRLDCDGNLVFSCGETRCADPFPSRACCQADGACGRSAGNLCIPNDLVEPDCDVVSDSFPACCSNGGVCGIAVAGECTVNARVTLTPCSAGDDCLGARAPGCCVDGMACGRVDVLGGTCEPVTSDVEGYAFTCAGDFNLRCSGTFCSSADPCCTADGACGGRDGAACTPFGME